jgi:hypothetical protein
LRNVIQIVQEINSHLHPELMKGILDWLKVVGRMMVKVLSENLQDHIL